MKIIVAPDKFKGSLDAFQVCKAIRSGINEVDESIEVLSLPMADGGDGFSTVMQHYLRTETISCLSADPLNRPLQAGYQWNENSKTAIIEMAVASGLVLLNENERNPLLTSTFGTGLLIKDAITKGATKIILGLGGSATNDGGSGILEALGFQLLDENNEIIHGTGGNLQTIKKIISVAIPNVKFEIACDVKNPLYGATGASFVYGPQKGANTKQVQVLEQGIKSWAAMLFQQTGREVANMQGAGAAGGIAAALLSYFDTHLLSGIELITSVSNIVEEINAANLLITGEGKIDAQSLDGKVIGKIAEIAANAKIPVIAFCGKLELSDVDIKRTGLTAAYAISESLSIEESMKYAATLLEDKTKQVLSNFNF